MKNKTHPWLKSRRTSIELTHCADGSFHALLTDPQGRTAEGFGDTQDAAYASARHGYLKTRRRTAFTAGLRSEGDE